MGTRYAQASSATPGGDGPQVRVSDADRDAVANLLGVAFAEGRLTAEEHHERLNSAHLARTRKQLREVTADLPAPGPAIGRGAAPVLVAEPDPCLLCLLLIVCPPAGIAWWLMSRRRAAAGTEGLPGRAGQLAPAEEPARTGLRALRREGPHA